MGFWVGVTRWGDKSGIWRFYRRVWKNIFYERRDKERERGVWGGEEGKIYIFLKFFEGGGGEFEILWGNVFLGLWGGEGERKIGKG